eukprot:Sspe_Gene.86905::Locus_57715_Transcript_1_1_Confidence_1.000_Length_1377::g.86905::m.86905
MPDGMCWVLLLACTGHVAGYTVQLLTAPDWEPLQPYNEYFVPCTNVTEVKPDGNMTCRGGFPDWSAAMRLLSAGQEHVLRMAHMEQNSQIIATHPDHLYLNHILSSRAGVEMMYWMEAAVLNDTEMNWDFYFNRSTLPVVVSNLVETNHPSVRGGLQHYYIRELSSGLRIAVLCVFPSNYYWQTMEISVVKTLVDRLRATSNVHVVVLRVVHRVDSADRLRLELGLTGADVCIYTSEQSSSKTIAVRKHGVDEGAHWTVDSKWGYQRVVAFNLDVDPVSRKVLSVHAQDLPLPELPPSALSDPKYREDLDFMQSILDKAKTINEAIGISSNAMPPGHIFLSNGTQVGRCRYDECSLGVLQTEALYQAKKVDVAFTNGGGMRAGWLPGKVTQKDFDGAFPYPSLLCYLSLKGSALLRALRRSVNAVGTDGKFNKSEEYTGHFLQVAG